VSGTDGEGTTDGGTYGLGVIGTGVIWERGHWPAIQTVEELSVDAVYDLDEERREAVAAATGATAVADAGAIFDVEAIDIVTIATPPFARREYVEAACAAGKHLMLEKPVARTLGHADDERRVVAGSDVTEATIGLVERLRAAGHRRGQEHILVSNVDGAWGVQAIRNPPLNPGFVDRFLVMAELHEIPAGLVFNKIDLIADESRRKRVEFWVDLYSDLGYPVYRTSAKSGAGIEPFKKRIIGNTSVLTGPSGVGKSTLLNRIEPGLGARTGSVSSKSQHGRHVTTHATLYPLSEGGYVIDTPGVREFGIYELPPEHLGWYFVEMQTYIPDCHFPSCTHDHEPKCAVKSAVENGKIARERYDSYLKILASLEEQRDDRP
jgi:ribosome biogenesis GTPase